MKKTGLKDALITAGLLQKVIPVGDSMPWWEPSDTARKGAEIDIDGRKYFAVLSSTDADPSDPMFEPSTKWKLTEVIS